MAGADESGAARVLVVAHRTAATPRLIDAVRARAQAGSCAFTLLVPRGYWDPDTEASSLILELALPLLEDAAGAPVAGAVGASDPFVAVRDTLAGGDFQEVIISTLPERVSHWLRRDLPSRVERLGVPVTVVIAQERAMAPPVDH
ncbi:MAG: hypothetical protein QOG77_2773 [Solirubrobacteraceae bacterium]|jgi:hypothetical protein|nr:hypothetical protein [Solirubrobacteraceae bacterium]